MQAVHAPPAAERHRRDAVRERVLGIGVEGADERQLAGRAERVPRDHRHDRLVDVGHVVAARAQLAAQRGDGVRRHREVGDRSVGREPDRAAERDEALGRGVALRARALVKPRRETVVRIERRDDARLVTIRRERARERLDVPSDTAGIGPGVRRDERDPHGDELYPQARPIAARAVR